MYPTVLPPGGCHLQGQRQLYLLATTPQSSRPGIGGKWGGATASEVFGTTALPVNTWSHLAATYDGTTVRLYVNGVQVASAAKTGPLATSTLPLEIGGDHIYGSNFQGRIDDVRVYSTALTPSQLQTDMNTPVG